MTIVEPRILFEQKTGDSEIRVWQQYDRRWLEFNDGLIQSEIILNRPEILPSVLSRALLAGMIFVERPRRVLLAGTGGGAIARYFSGCFPEVKGEAIEVSEIISQIAQDFFEFPDTDNWQLIEGDIRNFVQDCQYQYDLVIIDIAVEQQTPEWILETKFLQQCRALLTEKGHIALNLLVDGGDDFRQALAIIRKAFDKNTACLSLAKYRNTVIFAFNKLPKQPTNITQHLPELDALWGIEFSEFYRQMLHDNPPKSGLF